MVEHIIKIEKMKYIYFCICCIILSCCDQRTEVIKIKKYYEDGTIRLVYEKRHNKLHGEYKQYYPSGNIKITASYKNGLQDSLQYYYYDFGVVKQKSFFKNGLLCGEVFTYDEKGNLSTSQTYIIKNDSSYINQVINYTDNGSVDKERSNFFTIDTYKDTIKYGEAFAVDVKLEASYYNKNMLVVFGDFDNNFNHWTYTDSISDRMDEAVDFKVHYSTTRYRKGSNVLRGIIHDYISYYENDSSQNILRDVRPLYFEVDFFVKN